MLHQGCEIMLTLNKQKEWYAIVVAGTKLSDIETASPAFDRAAAYQNGQVLADAIVAGRAKIVQGAE